MSFHDLSITGKGAPVFYHLPRLNGYTWKELCVGVFNHHLWARLPIFFFPLPIHRLESHICFSSILNTQYGTHDARHCLHAGIIQSPSRSSFPLNNIQHVSSCCYLRHSRRQHWQWLEPQEGPRCQARCEWRGQVSGRDRAQLGEVHLCPHPRVAGFACHDPSLLQRLGHLRRVRRCHYRCRILWSQCRVHAGLQTSRSQDRHG
ncbi:hypothetical protein JI435_422630 [Parastagonospora nodorum SN15]|uniref:Uncharacterized protein n=1 Tax=Phaeosphaeria nodorum (strain SN15 / ATCC MYA-4574 / FGSC 10173) TaxID=321614 RepID=A0A7U2NPF8_PHANO|nr:hypothetical protein HBH54_095300 [Parastagonospora nodorum]QRD05686.1 hypothetical protein JI435_422630 [Parastagonospora nodorum SN15]KAH4028539.1 hypothetical protein HBI09_138480 [Parastagonospora nodorum]KAH4070603.1 hypothetical protein HBH50_086030 [Parastagonospora nodorum]KAH4159505.1 hypothetical protein HBH44_105110 [Parastagonospora nodorum]